MFTPLVRFLLVAACLGIGIRGYAQDPVTFALGFGGAVILAVGHFRYATVWLAFRALRRGDSESARRHVEAIRRPHLLTAESRAYYEWILGTLAVERGDVAAGLPHLVAALEGSLRTTNDRSAVACSLAEACLRLQDRESAARHVATARSLPHSPSLDPLLAGIESRLAATAA